MAESTDDLRVGIAGLGIAARQVIPAFKEAPGVRLTAVADVRAEALEEFGSWLGVRTFTSVDAMCESNEVDAVWVSTPNPLHSQHTITAASSGKHVICEKPMAVTLDEAQAMVEAIERNGVKYVQGHSKIFTPPIRKMVEIAASGELGRVIQVNSWHYRSWLDAPRLASELDTRQGGGALYRQGPHQVDIARGIAGGLVRSVRGTAGRWHPDFDTEGDYTAYLDFEDGAVATVVLNGYGHFDITELTWGIGEDGVANLERPRRPRRSKPLAPDEKYALPQYRTPRHTVERQRPFQSFLGLTIASCERGDMRQSPNGLYVYGEEGRTEVECGRDIGHAAELRELAASVRDDRPTFPDARWGMATLEVVTAILQSTRERREIMLQHQVARPPLGGVEPG